MTKATKILKPVFFIDRKGIFIGLVVDIIFRAVQRIFNSNQQPVEFVFFFLSSFDEPSESFSSQRPEKTVGCVMVLGLMQGLEKIIIDAYVLLYFFDSFHG
jgi:hypothetical protein